MGVNVTKNDTFKFSVTDASVILKPKDVTNALIYTAPKTPEVNFFLKIRL